MVDLRLCWLGSPSIEYDGGPLRLEMRKTLALLAYLSLSPQNPTRETLAALFWPPALWFSLAGILFFYGSALPFLGRIRRSDPPILWAAFGLLLCRAAALGMGLAAGFLIPPRASPKYRQGLLIGPRLAKRAMDITGALAGLVVSIPVIVAAAIAIKLDSPGPIFFTQERCGENGRPFRMVKLRTMNSGAEQEIQQVLKHNHLEGPAFKIPGDPRVTRVGRLLRRWSLDELPQLWNILKGEMSLIGPRPEETWVVAQYNDFQRQRLLVKPGLTGPMQVYGRGDLDMDARMSLELEYIQHYSILEDFRILWRTIPAIISGKGAY